VILTRASSSGQLDKELGAQLLTRRNTLWIACGVMLMLALIPGLPKMAFVLMAGGVALVARKLPATPVEEVEAAPLKKGEKTK